MNQKKFLIVEVLARKKFPDEQLVWMPSSVLNYLKATPGDYLQLRLPHGLCLICEACPVYAEARLSMMCEGIKHSGYPVTCTSSVAVNYHLTGENVFKIDMNDVKVLKPVLIHSLALNVTMRTVNDVVWYKKNPLRFLLRLEKLLSLFGIVSDCDIDFSFSTLAKDLGISKVKVGEVESVFKDQQFAKKRKEINLNSGLVGRKFCPSNILNCTTKFDLYGAVSDSALNSEIQRKASKDDGNQLHDCTHSVTASFNNLSVLARTDTVPSVSDRLQSKGSEHEPNQHWQTEVQPDGDVAHCNGLKSTASTGTGSTWCSNGRITVTSVQSEEMQLWQVAEHTTVGGMDEAQALLSRYVEALKHKGGIDRKGTLLMSGPEGCGKRSLVRQVCSASHTPLLVLNCHSLQGATAATKQASVAKYFSDYRGLSQEQPCVLLLLQDADHLLLNEMVLKSITKGIRSCRGRYCVVITSSQSHPQLPPSLPVRTVTVGSSTLHYRTAVLHALASRPGLPLLHGLQQRHLQMVAAATPGYVASDLHQVVLKTQAALERQSPEPHVTCASLLAALGGFTPLLVKTNPLLGERPVGCPLGGMEELQTMLARILQQMMAPPSRHLRNIQFAVPTGVLLYGPPGCGKTQLVCGLASSRGCTFFVVQPKHILSPYVGDTEKNLQKVFSDARVVRPAVIFFDEIDGLFGDRSSGELGGVRGRLLTEMLVIMGGAQDNRGILVCGATNNPEKLDAALLRPGRFDKVVYVPPPSRGQRLHILQMKCRLTELEEPEVLEEVASNTESLTGADLESIVRKAVKRALMDGSVTAEGRVLLTASNLRRCVACTPPTLTPGLLKKYHQFRGAPPP